jgi:hypothetical protein
MAVPVTTPVKQRSDYQWKKCISEECSKAREQILPALASSLSEYCYNEWVPVVDLFEESAMHGLAFRNVFRSLFRNRSFEIRDTQAYTSEENGCILLRHKFSSKFFILGCYENRMSRDEAEYIKTALHLSDLPGTRKGCVSEKIQDGVRSIVSPTVSAALWAVSQLVTAKATAESALVVVTPPERASRSALRTQKV